jgi:hypothetical protein
MFAVSPPVGFFAFRVSEENEDEANWVPIRSFQDITLAHLCVSFLESEGVRAVISNDHQIQMFPGVEKVIIYVPATQKRRALDLLTEFESKREGQPLSKEGNQFGVFRQMWLWWVLIAVIIALLLLQLFMEKYNGQLTW